MPNAALDPEVTPEVVARHGLTPEEFIRIKKILGREPNFTELGIFSVMWSEHCSYKNSRRELKKFPTTGPNILVRAGEENAGVVDIADQKSRPTGGSLPALCRELRTMATASASRLSAAKFISTKALKEIRW